MRKRPHHIEDLLLDEGFRHWVFGNSREDENFWNHWWRNSPNMREKMKEARKILLDLQPHQVRVSREEMDEGFMEISEYFDRQMGRKKRGPVHLSNGFLMKAAASLLVMFMLGIGRYTTYDAKQETTPAQPAVVKSPGTASETFPFIPGEVQKPAARSRKPERKTLIIDTAGHPSPAFNHSPDQGVNTAQSYRPEEKPHQTDREKTIHYRTGKNQRKKVVLPDGSTVYMNEQTKIAYHARWQERPHRRVELEGEAFFYVQQKQRQGQVIKFSVVTPDLRVEVLGTRFDVSTGQEQSRVYLSSGKIKLNIQARQQPLQLKPGDMVKYNPNSRELQVNKSTPHSAIQWLEAFKANHPVFSQNNRMTIGSPQTSRDKQGQNKLGRILQQGQNNSAHIRQVGSNLRSLQLQQGQGNQARAILKGNNRQTDDKPIPSTSQQIQQGQDNISIINIMEAYNTHVQSLQLGQRNRSHTRSKGSNNRGIILQTGQANEITLLQQGGSNEAVIIQSGAAYQTSRTRKLTKDWMKGRFNEIRIIQQGVGNKAHTRQKGNHNTIRLRQNGH